MVWPAVQMLNFRVLPIQFQIVSVLSLLLDILDTDEVCSHS